MSAHPRALLAVFAHPDDEAFGCGGTLARYAAEGVRVTLVCATRGEVGEISDPALATPETLGTVREGELRCAAEALGVANLVFFDWRDSGMAGTADNADPRAFVNAPAEAVVERLTGVIRQERPDAVITFDPAGGYGHPDHIAIHTHTLSAVETAADPARYPAQGATWRVPRLFYAVIPSSRFRAMRDALADAGVDVSEFEQFDESLRFPDEQVTATLDVGAYVDAKQRALRCHATQFGAGSIFNRVPEDVGRRLSSQEHFAQAIPAPTAGERLDDLFGASGARG